MAIKQSKNHKSSATSKAQSAWLAGLGAVSIAQKRGSELLTGLAAEGRDFQVRTSKLAREVGMDASVHVKGVIAPLRADFQRKATAFGAAVQSVVAGVLAKFGIPSKADIDALSQRMAALSRQIKTAK